MDYLRMKYAGYESVSTESLKDELLLSPGEFVLIKKEIADTLNLRGCPGTIPFKLFDDLVTKYI